MAERLHPTVRITLAAVVFLTGCRGLFPKTEASPHEATPISSPSPRSIPEITPPPTPDIYATQEAQFLDLKTAEAGEPLVIIDAITKEVVSFPWEGGQAYMAILELPGKEQGGFTALQAGCVLEALKEGQELGEKKAEGIWQPPNAKIEVVKGIVRLPATILGNFLKLFGIETPVVDLTQIQKDGKVYECKEETLVEKEKASLRRIFEKAKPQLEKLYPQIEQFGDILGGLLDLAEQEIKSRLTPTPSP